MIPDPLPIDVLVGPVDATVAIPGSKSITNRALVCAALAPGASTLDGVLFADDTEAMLECLTRLGAVIATDRGAATARIDGLAGRLRPGPIVLDARLSGTTARFVLPVLGIGPGPYVLDGRPPLRARPMGDGVAMLRALDVEVEDLEEPGHLPLRVRGARSVGGGIAVPGEVSSQFLSGLLLAAPCYARAHTIGVDGPLVSSSYVAMTIAVMRAFGAEVVPDPTRPNTYAVPATGYRPTDYRIEPDASAASYFFAAAAITGGRVRIEGLGAGSLQGDVAFVDVLAQMGAEVERGSDFIEVRGTGRLHGLERVDMGDLSDTAQTLAAVAVFAEGPTEVTGIGFIRRKETDRIAAVVTELQRCGIEATETDDGFRIEPGWPQPAVIQTYDDHRMAMSFALLGLKAEGIRIADPGCVAKTFPGFWDALDQLRSPGTAGD